MSNRKMGTRQFPAVWGRRHRFEFAFFERFAGLSLVEPADADGKLAVWAAGQFVLLRSFFKSNGRRMPKRLDLVALRDALQHQRIVLSGDRQLVSIVNEDLDELWVALDVDLRCPSSTGTSRSSTGPGNSGSCGRATRGTRGGLWARWGLTRGCWRKSDGDATVA